MSESAAVNLNSAATQGTLRSLLQWLTEGARSLLFKQPRWQRLEATPGRIAILVIWQLLLTSALQRIYIDGIAEFHWDAATAGWVHTVLLAWACYLLRPRALDAADPAHPAHQAPSAAHILTLLVAQSLCMSVYAGILFTVMLRSGALDQAEEWVHWLIWLAPVTWITSAVLTVLLRAAGPGRLAAKAGAAGAVLLAATLTYYAARPPAFWRVPEEETETPALAEQTGVMPAAAPAAQTLEEDEGIRLTQELIEAQVPLLARQSAALKPQRPGVIDVYTITFAPFEGEEVFRRESRMVSQVMEQRFDAGGRGLQLINHRDTAAELPWATPNNLERAINAVAKVMDRNEDVLFIHLTSHGASDGELATDFWPLDVAPVVPPALRMWLDRSGIRFRVLSISACYSGSWIPPLEAEGTLVMTASDASHTSYGCGKKSDLTFFGRAMYDEQLRNTTLSFEDAHAAARKVILQREKEAGKDDGYSNPQIKIGRHIAPVLRRLRERLDARAG